ncbi:hypothetical protein AOQ84DRAFT_440025 [Glonium stellatum]|uniref:DUF7357 domain-containing protein n=1 Tax=Glonium stellatum TaxID=574774 RepID=A0A8E2JSP0_9PEZI|nr:hypothetical protein AOQ84DRAFT_440025 [Glonium stellatum]
MRLRLSIQRHALPPVEVLWNISEEQSLKLFSVAQLLEEINHIIPLESQDWGLEDYVVEVGGFECLHFSQVAQVLKDEDRVCIRALQTPDVRARTLSGRYQISENGQHLIDGIPFGRPYLRQPNRPAIHIPPRKRRRLTYGEGGEEERDGEGTQGTVPSGLIPQHWKLALDNPDDDEDDEDDGDFDPKSQANNIQDFTLNQKKSVRFKSQPSSKELITLPLGEDDSEEEYDPHWDSESLEASEDEEGEVEREASASEGSSDSNSDDDSDGKESSHESEASSSSDSSDSDASSEASSESEPEELPSKPTSSKQRTVVEQNLPLQDLSPYGEGKKATQERNRRRRDTRKIRRLQMVGVLPATAKRNDLRKLEATRSPISTTGPTLAQSRAKATMTKGMKHTAQELDLGRQQLLTAIESGGIDVALDRLKKQFNKKEASSKKTDEKQASPTSESNMEEYEAREFPGESSTVPSGAGKEGIDTRPALEPPPEPHSKRARIDLAGSRRLLFGSLGVRNPKTKADEEELKAKLMAAGKAESKTRLNTQSRESRSPENNEAAELKDSDAWKSKINLTAFECWDDDVELSTPPFPFQQRWDPQQKQKKGKKNKKRKRMDAQYYEGNEETFGEGDPDIFLNYDDEDPGPSINNMLDTDSAVQSQLQLDIEGAATRMEFIDDLPPLPADLSTLPALKEEDMRLGNIIVFKQLECSPATNWAPAISPFRTATVEELTEIETFGLRLAERDQPQKRIKYDENGKRVYEKFEMEYISEDEDQPGADSLLYLSFEDLVEPKLLNVSLEITDQNDCNGVAVEGAISGAHEQTDDLEGQAHDDSPRSPHAINDDSSIQECHVRLDRAGRDEMDSLMNGKSAMEQSTLVETSA